MTKMMLASRGGNVLLRKSARSAFRRSSPVRNFSSIGNKIGIRIPEKAVSNMDQIVQQVLSLPVRHSGDEVVTIGLPNTDQSTFEGVSNAIAKWNVDKKVVLTAQFGYRNIGGEGDAVYAGDIPIEENGRLVGIYNISEEHLNTVLEKCYDLNQNENVDVVILLHNPEVQLQDAENVEEKVLSLKSSFNALEHASSASHIKSYGISSNGLCLSPKHPLHLSIDLVLDTVAALTNSHGEPLKSSALSDIQLPINLLERNGLQVAEKVENICKQSDIFDIGIISCRPLTCYPDGGVGSGFPFKLIDYNILTNMIGETQWTHKIPECPAHYAPSLNAAMGHFDAEELVEIEQDGDRKLTTEEIETLEGCRLLQSMLADLDLSLHTMRSFEAYENDLSTKVIPMIHDTFEELDEESAKVLQTFFAAHGAAARHAIAKTTRAQLISGGSGVTPYDIPKEVKLQEYALLNVLKDERISKVMVGCSQPQHVLEAYSSIDA
mmetsp:Transcript_16419/g.21412  ORF Transcript_16419/g.21412 Transcript_16419/m.21412 type:complete len:493 (-) Transcript_16419:1496-2974(-)